MKTFHCPNCDGTIFFENTACVACGTALAYSPKTDEMVALTGSDSCGWKACANYSGLAVCNWAIEKNSPQSLCDSCSLTQVVPNLADPKNIKAWRKIEVAKRRLLHNLSRLGLNAPSKEVDPKGGIVFKFLEDVPGTEESKVLTGHASGVITINIAEADGAERERRRSLMGEPYRTLLGHMRHEIGHYFWDRLINGTLDDSFRQQFGDERQDYAEALARYYQSGPPADWQGSYISAYATAHPWEDWAETWTHYLHMASTLETAKSSGIHLIPPRDNEPRFDSERLDLSHFNSMVESWPALSYLLNNLNRSLGTPDAYPFVLSPVIAQKLRFVHEVVERNRNLAR